MLHAAKSTVVRAAGLPSIFTFGEPLLIAPSGGPKLFTMFVTAELTSLIRPPSASVPAVPSASTATVANPPVPTIRAEATANTAAAINAPAITPASAPKKLEC
ncbi:hypothetical protein [Xenorhabdus bovienii]|uniref:hypothetical protein n=1 Tax=Xenorhabdus bovienii TaxID=40576 RepID=UPI0023B29481|nr:hypothetical protein [Xenorhabdus bovienii]